MAITANRATFTNETPTQRSLWQILLDGGFTDRAPTTGLRGDRKLELRFPTIDPIDLNVALAVQEDFGSREGLIRSAAGDRRQASQSSDPLPNL